MPAVNLVRAALENESACRNEQREALLKQALRQNPNDSQAHWQLGHVRVGDAWLSPSQVEQSARQDHRLAEYRRLRDAAGPTVEDQVALAQWCRKNKLNEEERIHWLLALELQPDQPDAIQGLRNLSLHPYQGTWVTDAQIAQVKGQAQKTYKAMEEWRPLVSQWQRADERHETSPPVEVREKISQISEPAEMLGLEWAILRQVNAKKDQQHRIVLALVKTLEDNPHPVVAQFFVRQSVFSSFEDVRQATAEGLKRHPLDHYVPLLLSGLQSPIEADIKCMLNATGQLATQYSFYQEGALVDFSSTSIIDRQTNRNNIINDGGSGKAAVIMAKNQQRNAARSVMTATRQTSAFRIRVQSINDAIEQRNARIVAVLNQTTGKDIGEEPTKWWDWWLQDYNGLYNITGSDENATDSESDKPVYQSPPPPEYESKPRKPVVEKNVYIALIPHSCFAPGTKVWTLTGRMPIGQIKVGDRVLAQNVESGELAYKPVLAVTTRSPGTRIKIGLGSDTITSTPSHPFWVIGEGWQMTKQLASGKSLHAISGGIRVETIEKQSEADQLPAEFAYNLIVDDFHSFFVGDQGFLVHDNTPREPTAAIVPGLLPQAPDVHKKSPQK
jgi:hypothetical protein